MLSLSLKYRIIIVLLLSCIHLYAKQNTFVGVSVVEADSVIIDSDTLKAKEGEQEVTSFPITRSDSVIIDSASRYVSSLVVDNKIVQEQSSSIEKRWIPDPKKAMWLAIAIPGGGQIYNKKYWKLPIVYGGFLGCFYALNWNNTMYRDYSQAYIDIMDSDDNTKSYLNFMRPGADLGSNLSWYQEQFKRKKNFYRRYRDMSMFCMIGVYLISIVDAYVDAEMSSFDISRDLTLKVSPAVINDRSSAMRMPSLNGASYGVNCSLSF